MSDQRKSITSASKSPAQQGNLTGPQRIRHDNIVAVYNAIQKWKKEYIDGALIIQSIQAECDTEDAFQKACEKLGVIVESMQLQVNIMKTCSTKLEYLKLLGGNQTVNVSWTSEDFSAAVLKLHEAYKMETKKKVSTAILMREYQHNSLQFEALAIAWTQLVSIKVEQDMTLRGMIFEAGITGVI